MLPMLHDGVTAASPRGVAWRMVRNPGQRCMIDRKALLDILRGGTNIEYGKGVGKVIQNEINVVVQCEDGEMMEADVLIGEFRKVAFVDVADMQAQTGCSRPSGDSHCPDLQSASRASRGLRSSSDPARLSYAPSSQISMG